MTAGPSTIPDLLGGPGRITALVGGGGKTTLLHALGAHLGRRAVLTTTTRMAAHETGDARLLLGPTPGELAAMVADDDPRPVLVWDRVDEAAAGGPKGVGVDPGLPATWLALVDHVVVEADGSRGHPAKAPAPHEPALPVGPVDVVAVIGADALDRVIADQCHRPLRLAAAVGCSPYERLTPERAAILLTSPAGSRRSVPDDAGYAVAVTKVDAATRPLVDRLQAALADRESGILVHRLDAHPQPATDHQPESGPDDRK